MVKFLLRQAWASEKYHGNEMLIADFVADSQCTNTKNFRVEEVRWTAVKVSKLVKSTVSPPFKVSTSSYVGLSNKIAHTFALSALLLVNTPASELLNQSLLTTGTDSRSRQVFFHKYSVGAPVVA